MDAEGSKCWSSQSKGPATDTDYRCVFDRTCIFDYNCFCTIILIFSCVCLFERAKRGEREVEWSLVEKGMAEVWKRKGNREMLPSVNYFPTATVEVNFES